MNIERHALHKCLCEGHRPTIVVRDDFSCSKEFCEQHDYEATVVSWDPDTQALKIVDSEYSELTKDLYSIIQYESAIAFWCSVCTNH